MPDYALSYVLTTYNKLPYLKQVMERLVAARQPDEEIVVADGGSQDGTPDYLRGLYEAGQIQQFVSERDKGESHGFNKCMLMARGEVLKLITDDDAFCYPAIREAAGFMLAHPAVDVMMGYSAALEQHDLGKAAFDSEAGDKFRRWLATGEPFCMIGLTLLIRRRSLPITGLFSTGVVLVDTEFTYRISSLKINLAWSDALLSVRLPNVNSNFAKMGNAAREREMQLAEAFYSSQFKRPFADNLRYRLSRLAWVEKVKTPLRPVKKLVFSALNRVQPEISQTMATGYESVAGENPLEGAFRAGDLFMARYNAQRPTEFLYKRQEVTKALQ